ncbi:MAG: tRNA (adenosine(37)-N6)-threonylcarbamoyltransferase complex dimerization subunit type 1 TsaB [Desulfobaccales bacterium]
MLILALDTATDTGSLALVEDEETLGESTLAGAGAYWVRLLPRRAALFAAAGRDPADLGAIGVSVGPGNFTGLRIGCATSKTLAWSLGCALVPVPTLEVLAAQVPFQSQRIGVVMDAKRGEVYWGLYRCPADQPLVEAEPVRLPLAEFYRRLTPPLILTGPWVSSVGDLPAGVALAAPESRYPRAATVALLTRRRLQAGLAASPQQLAPSYLRPAL